MNATKYNVLFLGGGNAARSIFAEAILSRDGAGTFQAFSAGVQPRPLPDAHAIDLLARMNFATAGLKPKSWETYAGEGAPNFDFIFSVCDAAAMMPRAMWRGNPVFAHWGIDDPAKAEGNESQIRLAYADAFRMLSNRIGIFVNLPLRSLDRLTVQRQLDRIGGKAEGAVAAA
ncbi:MAG TPA: arsenate reductase ArsC [Pseudolabrys sp.]|nr:arsenate reductase ArsC [Pseudolabrys sp.]